MDFVAKIIASNFIGAKTKGHKAIQVPIYAYTVSNAKLVE